ncbi:MAG: iron-sulfur cluster assembly scaffold protein [Planctomycetota bacterium]
MTSEEEIYQEHILDHYEDPFHNGPLEGETHAHEDKNPLCGDVVRIALKLDANGKVADCAFEGGWMTHVNDERHCDATGEIPAVRLKREPLQPLHHQAQSYAF